MGEVVSTIPSMCLLLGFCFFLVFGGFEFCFIYVVLISNWSQIPIRFDAAIGFNVETVQYNNIKFQVWDLGNFGFPFSIM